LNLCHVCLPCSVRITASRCIAQSGWHISRLINRREVRQRRILGMLGFRFARMSGPRAARCTGSFDSGLIRERVTAALHGGTKAREIGDSDAYRASPWPAFVSRSVRAVSAPFGFSREPVMLFYRAVAARSNSTIAIDRSPGENDETLRIRPYVP
jgi:hypothetical protein